MNQALMPDRTTTPRLLVPDLARGLALLGIAMANAVQTWMINDIDALDQPGSTLGGVRPGNTLDEIAAVFSAVFLHVRGLPMFSTLLGFGIGLVAASAWRKGYPAADARLMLVRRYGFLALFGIAHMMLVFYGDIMLYYGLIGMLVATMFTASNKALRITAYSLLLVGAAFGTVAAVAVYGVQAPIGVMEQTPTPEMTSLGVYFGENLLGGLGMLINAPFAVFQLGGLVLLGYVWAREGYLINVEQHKRVLVRWTILGAVVAIAIGIPWGLSAAGFIDPQLEQPLFILNLAWGLFTGPAILAALALATNGVQQRINATGQTPAWARPFIALGKRSMSGYLAQSFLFIALVMPFGLGWGVEASISGKLLVGFVVWLITLLLAMVLERVGLPGPFEQLHRRASYGKTKRLEPYTPPLPQ
ncbi:DUF418 domain-containing protein [Corynebacterium riegelii]|uniref:DUF418 domain-containing protein n=1 Tax=Corynebacterium riegelii TaxID=156976 RepID=UPI001F2DE8B6|nr:DUF418 domain-containing protein [Corynebacterium riegelii]